MKKLLAKIRKILHDRRTRQMFTRIVSVTAAIVVFITTYALVLPAITMESEANCGIEAHQHDESCYEDKLICGEIESPGHHHSEACYEVSKALVCEEQEHQHDDSCFDESGNLTCGQLEHTHDDTCYKESRELTCDIPESDGHQHSSACYERVLTCGKEIHTHSTACYEQASDTAASASADFAAVATTELGSSGATVSASTEIETESGESDAASSETSDEWATKKNAEGGAASPTTAAASTTAATTAGTSSSAAAAATTAGSSSTAAAATNTATASTSNTAFDSAAAEDTYIPQLEPVIFEQLLTKDTDIYYYHAEEGQEAPESSADIADWKRVNDDTELTPADLLRVYLRYTIPAGTLNATNDIARYRLPSNLHLTDQQMETINTTVNGVANQYVSLDTLEITDTEKYNTYLGIEATEGTRKPSDNVDEYFADHPDLEGQEYINAVVRAENVFDDTTGEYADQDLVLTFSPYTVQKNQHEYDADGQPTKAGQKVDGWLCFDLHMDQIDWSEPVITTIEDPAAPAQDVPVENTENIESSDTTEATEKAASDMDEDASLSSSNPDALNTNTLTEKKESSAEIVFAAKDKTFKIDEISTELHLVEFNTIETENDVTQDEHDQSADDSTNIANSEITDYEGDTADDTNLEGESEKPESADESATDIENQPESAMEINAETYPAVSFEDAITVQAGTLSTDNENASQDTPAETAITVSVIAEEKTFPLGTTMQLGTVVDMDTVASAVEGAVEGQTRGFHAVDISFHNADGEEIEPLKPIKVSMTSDAIKQAVEDSSTAPVVVHLENPTDSNHTDSPDRAGDSNENSTYNSSSGIPGIDENAFLDTTVSASADENANINTDRPQVDTTINAPVATIIETTETTREENSANKKETPDTLSFDAGSFSVYAIVYTVDFHWEVNGKMYDFSIPGGGFVSFYSLVDLLGVEVNDTNTDKDEIKELVDGVASITFSNTELVSVSKVEEDTTVGAIKERLGLQIEYSAELTEKSIDEINAQEVKVGDWALIAIKPFDTEESLTVTMKNGEQWTVKVTDAQKPYKDVDYLENGNYLIYRSDSSNSRYMFLKNDGTTAIKYPANGEALNVSDFSSYTWSVTKNWDGSYTIKSTNSNRYVSLTEGIQKVDRWSKTSYSSISVNLAGHDGITIAQGNNVLKRNDEGFYYDTGTGVGLTFYKIENDPSGSTSHDTGIELTDEERDELSKWEETIEKFNTLTDYDKTAEASDYDNRIYKIDLKADSGIMDFYKDVDLGFVLDVSNSMKFPSSLKALEDQQGNEYKLWMDENSLNAAYWAYEDYYNRQGCFYILSDPALTSTIYRVFWNGSKWQYQDASSNDSSKIYDVNDGTTFKEPFRQSYTLYYADDQIQRIDYLNNSVAQAVSTLKKIVQPTEGTDDETANVRIAYNFFAGTKTGKDASGHTVITQYAIRGSHDFVDLRSQESRSFEVKPKGYEADGTRQDLALYDSNNDPNLGANEFGWDTDTNVDRYVILVTDGAPNGASMSEVEEAAKRLKREDKVKLITIGLSTKDVDGGSTLLKTIADDVDNDGTKDFYEAEKASDLKHILSKILQTIMAKGLVRGKVTDTIDKGFYPVDSQGNPLPAGVYKNGGRVQNAQISDYVSNGKPTAAHQNEVFYTWEQVGDEWKITWYNQEIGWDDNDASTGNPWKGTVYVKAKEDYLGGNLIETNDGHAQIEPTGIKLVIDGTPEPNWRPLENMPKIDLPIPRVNVHELETDENSTTWTIYKGTSVTPGEQIKALWDEIPIEEVVNPSEGGQHKRTSGAGANVGTSGVGETFSLGSLMAEISPTFNIDNLINQISATKSSASASFEYEAYDHKSGTITVTVERTKGDKTPTEHTADTIGEQVEQYKVTFTYTPYTEAQRHTTISAAWTPEEVADYNENGYHNGPNGRGNPAGTMTSTNTHTINIFQKGIKITKVDKTNTNQTLSGAVFELFRVDAKGSVDGSAYGLPSGSYSKVGGDLTTDANGIITINPVIPDKDNTVANKTLYQPNIAVGASENTSHDTVFYLVEKTPPTKSGTTYARMPGAIKFILTLTENKGDDSTASLYDWTQIADVSSSEYGNGTAAYLIDDGEDNSIYAYRLKNSTYGGLKILKHVTYNHEDPTTATQKSKLAGTYTFTIFTDEECEAPYLEDGHEKTLTVTINNDGTSQYSQEVILPPGKYWIRENEPENDAYSLQEKVEVTVESDQTGEHAAIAAFTNNINEGEDEAMITVRKTFSGIKAEEIPAGFSVTVTNGTNSYVLTKEPHTENITWEESDGGLIWTWKIYGIIPGTTYTVSESGENVSGYTVTTTGTGSSQTISPAQMTFTIAEIATTCSHNDWPVSDNTLFAASTTNKTGGKGTLIVTKNRLSLSERKAVEETLRPMLASSDSNVWKTPVRYYSIQDHPNGFKINAGVVTYNVDNQEVILSDTDIWQHVASVSFTKTDPTSADFNVTNTYRKKDINISLVKVDVSQLNDTSPATLPGATFTLEKYISLNPANKDTEWGTNGSVTIADTEETGTFSFTGLSPGYYKILEDVFPEGYVRTAEVPVIEVRSNASTGELEVFLLQKTEGNTYVDVSGNNDGTVKITNNTITVGNTPGVALPSAGGPGTKLIYILGLMLTAFAGISLMVQKNRKNPV